ncbi:MAG: hypothetical protein DDT37_01894 [Firmicutes bacterium]|nr:hypothetical protein [candidate division NPL-UPA2 bacterium]
MHIEKNAISVNGNIFEYAVAGTKSPAIILINGAGGALPQHPNCCRCRQ